MMKELAVEPPRPSVASYFIVMVPMARSAAVITPLIMQEAESMTKPLPEWRSLREYDKVCALVQYLHTLKSKGRPRNARGTSAGG